MHNPRTILVTGAAGFIGSTFANMTVQKYPDDFFVLLDALTPVADIHNLDEATLSAPNCHFEKADIRDQQALERLFETFAITDIINFAAETHVDVSLVSPQTFVETNILGTHTLLQVALSKKINRFHQISTDEVYGALGPKDTAFTENTPLAPRNPYSASKASADFLVLSYHRTFGLNTTITRSSNNYGPRQDTTKLIPRFISQLLNNKKVPLYGNGENVRDWLFVEDNARAIDLVFRNGTPGEVYNIGGNCELSNIAITQRLIALTDRSLDAIEYVPDRLGHDFRYAISNDKIERELGWSPEMNLESGLKCTVDYFRNKRAEM